jgi:hypothetical protein
MRFDGRQIQLLAFGVLLIATSAWGQVRIQGTLDRDVPKEKVDLLYRVTCRVVAEEFHMHDASEVSVPVTLILGDDRSGVVGDETNQVFTVHMPRWDEALFVASISRIAIQHLLSHDRKARIVRESLRRARAISPVSVGALKPTHHEVHASLPAQFSSPSASHIPAEREGRHRPPAFCQPAVQSAP